MSAQVSESPWLRGRVESGRPAIVCCPHSGGSATYFNEWPQAAGDSLQVLAVQYPGRHERMSDPFATSIGDIACALAELISDFGVPVVMFGHSMGAAVAFETTCLLSRAGNPPRGLIVSSHTPPQEAVTDDTHRLPDDQMWARLAEFGGTEQEILDIDELKELYAPVIRSDLQLTAEYVRADAAGSLDLPLIAITGKSDQIAPPSALENWRAVTTERFRLLTVDGNHFYLDTNAGYILDIARDILSAD